MSEYYAEGRPLSREGAFQLVAEEVWCDGQVEEFEQQFLEALGRFLSLDLTVTHKILTRVKEHYEHGKLGEARRLDPELLYHRILYFIWSDQHMDQLEGRIREGLRRVLRISESRHEEILAAVRST